MRRVSRDVINPWAGWYGDNVETQLGSIIEFRVVEMRACGPMIRKREKKWGGKEESGRRGARTPQDRTIIHCVTKSLRNAGRASVGSISRWDEGSGRRL